jgi:hypothetical protein
MRLVIEAQCGARIDKLYTLLENHEITPRTSYEIQVGDLHSGDACHIPLRVWLPPLTSPTPFMDVIRISLTYVDALKIDTKSCEMCAGVARVVALGAPLGLLALPTNVMAMDRERNRVLVTDALQRAVTAANGGSLDAACAILADAETVLDNSLSMQQNEPVCVRLQDVIISALRRLEEALADCKCRTGTTLLDKMPNLNSAPQRAEGGSVLGVLLSSTLPGTDARMPLKPRTFSVSLPLSTSVARYETSISSAGGSNSGSLANSEVLPVAYWHRRPLQVPDVPNRLPRDPSITV